MREVKTEEEITGLEDKRNVGKHLGPNYQKGINLWDCDQLRAENRRYEDIRERVVNQDHFLWKGQREQRKRHRDVGTEGRRNHEKDSRIKSGQWRCNHQDQPSVGADLTAQYYHSRKNKGGILSRWTTSQTSGGVVQIKVSAKRAQSVGPGARWQDGREVGLTSWNAIQNWSICG